MIWIIKIEMKFEVHCSLPFNVFLCKWKYVWYRFIITPSMINDIKYFTFIHVDVHGTWVCANRGDILPHVADVPNILVVHKYNSLVRENCISLLILSLFIIRAFQIKGNIIKKISIIDKIFHEIANYSLITKKLWYLFVFQS